MRARLIHNFFFKKKRVKNLFAYKYTIVAKKKEIMQLKSFLLLLPLFTLIVSAGK